VFADKSFNFRTVHPVILMRLYSNITKIRIIIINQPDDTGSRHPDGNLFVINQDFI